jgi:small-conductance mechanosensitive channel
MAADYADEPSTMYKPSLATLHLKDLENQNHHLRMSIRWMTLLMALILAVIVAVTVGYPRTALALVVVGILATVLGCLFLGSTCWTSTRGNIEMGIGDSQGRES